MYFKKACTTKVLTERGWRLYDRSNYYKTFVINGQKYRIDLQFKFSPHYGYTELVGMIYSKEPKYTKNFFVPIPKNELPKNILKKVFNDIEALKKKCKYLTK